MNDLTNFPADLDLPMDLDDFEDMELSFPDAGEDFADPYGVDVLQAEWED